MLLAKKLLAVIDYAIEGWDLNNLQEYPEPNKYYTAAQSATPRSVFFKPDGTEMYVSDFTNEEIYQYTLTTAWDLSTASYASKSLSSFYNGDPTNGMVFSADGTTLFTVTVLDYIEQYNLSTAWDISTATYSNRYDIGLLGITGGHGIASNSTGTIFYVADQASDLIYQFTASTAWSVSTLSYASKSMSFATQEIDPSDLFLSSDGTKAYITGYNTDSIYQYTLTTAWDISTGSYASKSLSVSAEDTIPHGLFFSSDGLYLFMIGAINDTVTRYTMSTSWDISTATLKVTNNFDISAQETGVTGLFFKPDGTKIYTSGANGDEVNQFSLSTAFDITTASFDNKILDCKTQDSAVQGLFIDPTGTKIYIAGNGTDSIYQYTLTTAWDVSTGSYANKSLSVASQDTAPTSVFFHPDGEVMFVCGKGSNTVHKYTLTIAWDLATASYASVSFSCATQETEVDSLVFNPGGSRMYISGNITDSAYQYDLSTAWDISTAVYNSVSFLSSQDTAPKAICFNNNGTKFYIGGANKEQLLQYYMR